MKYYTVSEVAKKYKVSKETIYKRIREGVINKAPNIGVVTRIPATELKKFQSQHINELVYDKDKVEVVETSLGKIRKIKSTNEYVTRDIADAIGLVKARNLAEKANSNNSRCLGIDESKYYGFRACAKGTSVINYDGVIEYSKRSQLNIDWSKFLNELKPSNEYVQEEFEELKADNSNALSKIFEGTPVEIITDKNGEPLFELYSTGMALGYVNKNSMGKIYPHKSRIDKVVENAEIIGCVHGVHKYLTESQLYDFMFEAKTDKCKSFRKWVTNEVLPTIRKTGGYVNNTEKFTENYFSNLSEDTREIIKNELENKNKELRLEKAKIEHELKSNTEIINLIDEA